MNEAAAVRLQNQPDFISIQLSQLPGTDMGVFPFELIVGSASASVTLTMLINPLCLHCGETLSDMMALVDIGKGEIKGVVRFLVGDNAGEPGKSLDNDVALLITGLVATGRNADALEALKKWFSVNHGNSGRFFKSLARQYDIRSDLSLEKVNELLARQRKWALQNGINRTPVLFLDNLALPDDINFKNLKYFLIRKLNN
ncbi:MAG: thioredoxin domain-containing protein [bacterium]|nr:thioredoxin domain-containing protein [bacterium]